MVIPPNTAIHAFEAARLQLLGAVLHKQWCKTPSAFTWDRDGLNDFCLARTQRPEITLFAISRSMPYPREGDNFSIA